MTTAGEDVAAAIRYAADKTAGTASEYAKAINHASGSVSMLALAVNNLAAAINKQQPASDEDGEPVRQPASAWPRIRAR